MWCNKFWRFSSESEKNDFKITSRLKNCGNCGGEIPVDTRKHRTKQKQRLKLT